MFNTLVKSRYRPPWTYKSSTSTDWALIQEAKVARGLSPMSRITRQQARQEKMFKLERYSSAAFEYDLAMDAAAVTSNIKESMRGRNRKRSSIHSRTALKLFYLIALTTCCSMVLFYCFNGGRVTEHCDKKLGSVVHSNRGSSVPGVDHSTVDPGKTLGVIGAAKEYVKSGSIFPAAVDQTTVDPGKTLGVIGAAKEYVKRDPDLFILMC